MYATIAVAKKLPAEFEHIIIILWHNRLLQKHYDQLEWNLSLALGSITSRC